ncbi:hypothetical protein IU501_34770 [Nocardia otitidiscaviarum]|uniref:hypothetical protein n=1 Tax=Nocardia otitidiscaviarum TaxID=1823 RepID=UPI001894E311|nr:hypothetical protein [Nocardia otitidiscaviarum]MBF6138135.1 hypothetical protein [Nocardia otitidiscaviarum]
MTNPIPAGWPHFAPPLPPQPFGLYSVTTPIDVPPPADGSSPRLISGVDWIPANCGPSGVWTYDLCPTPDPAPEDEKTGERPDDGAFPPVIVWAVDECSLYATDTSENEARAQQILRLHEPLWVERHLAALLAARATALPAAASLAAAVGALEEALGDTGFAGVLHARRGLAAQLADLNLVAVDGGQARTPLTNLWSFGGGYTDLGDTLYATGPITIWCDPVTTRTAVEHTVNAREALAERRIVVGWECPTTVYSVTVS